MRLTIVVSSTQRRGAEVFAESIGNGLAAGGWDVDFVALADRPAGLDGVAAAALSPFEPARLPRLDVGIVRRLRTRVRTRRPDVVLANGSSTLQYCLAAVRTTPNRPRLAYASVGEPLYWAADPRRQITYRLMLGMVDRVFAVSSRTAEQLTGSLGVRPERLRVLPTGVPARYLGIERERHDGPLRVLWVGSLSHEKDPLAAVEVLANAADSIPLEAVMVGDGPLRSDVAQRANELGVALELPGVVSDVAPLYARADVLLLTSRTEGLPGVILEASAAGLPVVAFDVGGVSEALVDGRTAVLVPDRRTESAARAVVSLGIDPERRASMAAAGRELVAEHFTLDAAVARYDLALKELMREPQR